MDMLEDVRHREWPLPDAHWILKQTWNDLLFAHWPVARDQLRAAVPQFFELDLFANEAWLSVTPFNVTDFSPLGMPPLPVISAFSEINVRTYVVYDGIPGVYFFSLDANSAMAVAGASTLFHLPYYLADIHAERRSILQFYSRRRWDKHVEFDVQYSPAGPLFRPKAGSLDYFLTERYCLYTQDSSANRYRVEIHHPPWELQPAEAQISRNTMIEAAGLELPSRPLLVHYARWQDVLIWYPYRLG
jgi:uncharacterized protein YqjF (DUF2071 family)